MDVSSEAVSRPVPEKACCYERHGPDHDCRIREVKCRPVETRNVEIKKIYDSTDPQAIEDIAERSSDNQSERHGFQARRRSDQKNPEQRSNGEADAGQHDRPIRERLVEQAEGNALVEAKS